MQNPLNTYSYTTHTHMSQFPTNQQDMQDHFNHLLGQSTSRYTAAETQILPTNSEQAFHSSRMFVIGTLESWGMKVGTLQYSKDNQLTVKCLLELISQKQRNVDQKIKAKEQLAAVNFQKEKYQSFLKQSKNALQQKDKQLGRLENECTELRKKIRLIQSQAKKQKAEDQKVIFMLKSKNEQILHEIKKRQVQVTRVKQQMKRNVLSKSTPLAKTETGINPPSNSVKNSFQTIQKIQRSNPSKWKKNITQRSTTPPNYADNFEQEKFTFMLDKYQKQKKLLTSENTLLRGKVFDIRQVLLKFAEWIDVQLFGQTLQQTKKLLEKKFICNHNLLFSKDALMADLLEVINEAKQGIQQLQQRLQETQSVSSQKSLESPMKRNVKGNGQSLKIISESGGLFKKKSVSIRETGTPGKVGEGNVKSHKTIIGGVESQKQVVKSQFQQQQVQKHSQVQRSLKPTTRPQPHQLKSPQVLKPSSSQYASHQLPSQIRPSKSPHPHQLQLSIFQNDILSDIYQPSLTQDADNSIVSHISASEFVKQLQKGKKDKYDKWDILFRTEGDDEEEE